MHQFLLLAKCVSCVGSLLSSFYIHFSSSSSIFPSSLKAQMVSTKLILGNGRMEGKKEGDFEDFPVRRASLTHFSLLLLGEKEVGKWKKGKEERVGVFVEREREG